MLRSPAARKKVLCVSYNPVLISGRSQAFQRAGYKVLSATNVDEALDAILMNELELVVLCATVPQAQQNRLIEATNRYRPGTKICLLSAGNVLNAA